MSVITILFLCKKNKQHFKKNHHKKVNGSFIIKGKVYEFASKMTNIAHRIFRILLIEIVMKNYKLIGFIACLVLAISCFLPWAYYPDLHKSFTGFFSEQNVYGKPGKVFLFFAIVSVVLIFIDKIWAKRTLIFLAALNIGYLIRTYIIFMTCYKAFCPQKQYGLYLLIISCIVLLAVSFFPDFKVDIKNEEEQLSDSEEMKTEI
jgi:hypothetical protein